jgi:uncharacterized RDD family membrane protein YckC
MISYRHRNMIGLVPPEGVPLRFELARVGERLTSVIIDMTIIIVSIIAFVLLFVFLMIGVAGSSPLTLSMFGSIMIIGIFFLRQGYFFFFELRWQGSTPGKRLSKIRVVSRDGSSLTLSSIVARNLFRDLELFVPLGILLSPGSVASSQPFWVWGPMLGWLGIMMALPLINKQNLRLGDLVAGTMVIRVPEAVLQVDKAARTASFHAHQEDIKFTPKQLSIYGEYELETLAAILRKADDGKAELVDLQVIANTIARKIRYDGPVSQRNPLRFLRVFYSKQRAFLEKQLLLGHRKASKHEKQDKPKL